MKLSKKSKLAVVMAIIVVVLIAIVVVASILLKKEDKTSVGNKGTIEYSILNDSNIVEKVNVANKNTINVKEGKWLVITDVNNSVVDVITQNGTFVIENKENNHYFVSSLQYNANVSGSIKQDNNTYNYEFILRFKITDPVGIFEIMPINENIKVSELFERVLDKVLRNNVNELILDYANSNDLLLSDVKEQEGLLKLKIHLLEELNEILEEDYYGVNIENINFKEITKK